MLTAMVDESLFEHVRTDTIGRNATIVTPFGEKTMLYADFIASGRALHSIESVIANHVLPLYANTHTEDSATGAMTTRLVHEADDYVKQCLGAGELHKLVWCGTGSTAAIKRLQEMLGLALPSSIRERVLATMTADERPVVFVGPYEHHSNEVTWRETLAEVVEIPLCPAGMCDLVALEAALTDPKWEGRKKIGSFSAASNVTGICTDTRAIARLLHEHDAWACFDFAASAPYVSIDMKPGEADGYDAIFISAHKFIGGPGTPGILVFDENMYALDAPTTAGGGTVAYVSSNRHRFLQDIEAREDAGTPAIVQRIRAALAFQTKQNIGTDQIGEREEAILGHALERLRANPAVEILGDVDAPRLAVISFLLRSTNGLLIHPRLVVRLLNDVFGIQARGGCACAGPYGHRLLDIGTDLSERFLDEIDAGHEGLKPGWTRISLHYTLTDAEVDFIVDAVLWLAEHGHRFIGPYALDWATGTWTPAVNFGVSSPEASSTLEPTTAPANHHHDSALQSLLRAATQAADPSTSAIVTSSTQTDLRTEVSGTPAPVPTPEHRFRTDAQIAESMLAAVAAETFPAMAPPIDVPSDLVYFRVSA